MCISLIWSTIYLQFAFQLNRRPPRERIPFLVYDVTAIDKSGKPGCVERGFVIFFRNGTLRLRGWKDHQRINGQRREILQRTEQSRYVRRRSRIGRRPSVWVAWHRLRALKNERAVLQALPPILSRRVKSATRKRRSNPRLSPAFLLPRALGLRLWRALRPLRG